MDPITALNVSCNALQLLDLAWKLVSDTQAIYNSQNGATSGTLQLETIAKNVAELGNSIVVDTRLSPTLRELAGLTKTVSSELSDALLKLNAQQRPGKLHSFRIALRGVWSKNHIKEFTDRIQLLQGQTMAGIQFSMMDQQSDVYAEILALQQTTRNLEAKLGQETDNLRQNVLDSLSKIQSEDILIAVDHVLDGLRQTTNKHSTEIEAISNKIEALIDSISNLGQDMQVIRSQQSVLRSFRFESFSFRHDRIPKAYAKTFEWAFEDQVAGLHGPTRLHFRKWLQSETGIFWVRGRAGSGKSTLFKFLSNNPRTVRHLTTWAGNDQDLIIAKHFFWNAGSLRQKSQEGLLRSFLFHFLSKRPEHIPQAEVQIRCRRADITSEEELWTWDLLWQMFESLMSDNESAKVCFFIDGLDEFEGDTDVLINTVRKMSLYPNIKICVSSRPWTEFVEEFGILDSRVLKLEDLTAQDIKTYVQDTLYANRRFRKLAERDDSIYELVHEVVDMSNGVFLWVYLVVRSLLEGMKFADSIKFLWKRLQTFPPDLDEFFFQMLEGVPEIYRSKTSSTLQCAMAADDPMPAMVYYFINLVDEDEDYVLKCPCHIMKEDEIVSSIEDTTARLDGWTKGLLEVVHYSTPLDYASSRVEFLHRTVRDFINDSIKAKKLISESLDPDWQVSGTLCRGKLLYLRRHPQQKLVSDLSSDSDTQIDFATDIAMPAFREILSHAVDAFGNSGASYVHAVLDDAAASLLGKEWKRIEPLRWEMCHHAAEHGLEDYLDKLLQYHFEKVEGRRGKFCHCLICPVFAKARLERLFEVTKYLLDQGQKPDAMWGNILMRIGPNGPIDDTVFDVLSILISAGANLDYPFGSSVFRNEISTLLPPERVMRLLLPDPIPRELRFPERSRADNSSAQDGLDDPDFWCEQDDLDNPDFWCEQNDWSEKDD